MKIVEIPATTVVGLEVKASLRGLWRAMPRAWDELFSRAEELGPRLNASYVDVSVEVVDGIYHQVVGREVERADRVPEGMVALALPAMRCLHELHDGSVTQIIDTFDAMYAWARRNRIIAGDFKLDRGYTPGFREKAHDLYIEVAS